MVKQQMPDFLLHTGDTVPPKALADACMATYTRLKQARFAVPALAALDRPRALSLLPKLVPLDVVAFKAAMHRLLLNQPGRGMPRESHKALAMPDLTPGYIPNHPKRL